MPEPWQTNARFEALAERIALATVPHQQIDFEGRDAWSAAHPEAVTDRRWIADHIRNLNRTMRWPETEKRAGREWLAMVLAVSIPNRD